jgi:hypothetical protein
MDNGILIAAAIVCAPSQARQADEPPFARRTAPKDEILGTVEAPDVDAAKA